MFFHHCLVRNIRMFLCFTVFSNYFPIHSIFIEFLFFFFVFSLHRSEIEERNLCECSKQLHHLDRKNFSRLLDLITKCYRERSKENVDNLSLDDDRGDHQAKSSSLSSSTSTSLAFTEISNILTEDELDELIGMFRCSSSTAKSVTAAETITASISSSPYSKESGLGSKKSSIELVFKTLFQLFDYYQNQQAKIIVNELRTKLNQAGFNRFFIEVFAKFLSKIGSDPNQIESLMPTKVLKNLDYRIKIQNEHSMRAQTKSPLAEIDFELQNVVEESDCDRNEIGDRFSIIFDHQELLEFYDQIETIQTEIDRLYFSSS